MTPFLLYIGRSSLYLALFYAFFLLVMRRTTFFRLNRILLLAGTVACFLLPMLRLRTVEVPFLMAGPLTEAASEPALTAGPSAASPFPYLELLYAIGFLAVLGWTAVAMVRMYRTIGKGAVTRLDDGTKLVLVDGDIPSFSWGRTIVMSRKDSEQNPVILQHEKAHIQKKHTLDILLFTAVTLVHWFNPLVWITLSELKLLHEYEADDAVLNHGIDATQYQLLLVRVVSADLPEIQPETVAELSETTPTAPDTTKAIPFSLLEVKPTFQGGEAGTSFSKWVNENLKYPQAAKDAGVQGRVTLQFIVYPDGSVRDTKVLRGAHPDLDAEALRVVSASPDWTPGYVNGEPVKVTYTFPVIFQLSGKKTEPKTTSIHVTGEANDVFIRGALADSVLFVLDGKPVNRKDVNLETIESIQVLKDEKAVEKYGEKGRNGVVEFTSKKQ